MTKLLRFGFEIGIPSAPITQKLKATTKTDENKLVISWAHRLRGARAGSTLREDQARMLTQLPQPATVKYFKVASHVSSTALPADFFKLRVLYIESSPNPSR